MKELAFNDIRQLIHYRSELCISFYLPAHEPEELRRNLIRLWNETYTRVSRIYSTRIIQKTLGQVNIQNLTLRVDPNFESLCVFASSKDLFLVRLDFPVKPKAVVDTSFYVKPLIRTATGDDQFLLLVAEDGGLKLMEGSLSAIHILEEGYFSIAPSEKREAVLRRMARVISEDRRPWFVAGDPSWVARTRKELSSLGLRRSPSAHILQAKSERIEEAARQVIRIQSEIDIGSFEKAVSEKMRNSETEVSAEKILEAIYDHRLSTLIVGGDPKDRRGHPEEFLDRTNAAQELAIDDIVEEAIAHDCKVISFPDLEERLSVPMVGILERRAV